MPLTLPLSFMPVQAPNKLPKTPPFIVSSALPFIEIFTPIHPSSFIGIRVFAMYPGQHWTQHYNSRFGKLQWMYQKNRRNLAWKTVCLRMLNFKLLMSIWKKRWETLPLKDIYFVIQGSESYKEVKYRLWLWGFFASRTVQCEHVPIIWYLFLILTRDKRPRLGDSLFKLHLHLCFPSHLPI